MTKDNFVVGGLALLMVVSTLFNASNAQAVKQEELVAKVAAQQTVRRRRPRRRLRLHPRCSRDERDRPRRHA